MPIPADSPENRQTDYVGVSTNLSTTKRTVKRVIEADAASIRLAESTATALDAALRAGGGTVRARRAGPTTRRPAGGLAGGNHADT